MSSFYNNPLSIKVTWIPTPFIKLPESSKLFNRKQTNIFCEFVFTMTINLVLLLLLASLVSVFHDLMILSIPHLKTRTAIFKIYVISGQLPFFWFSVLAHQCFPWWYRCCFFTPYHCHDFSNGSIITPPVTLICEAMAMYKQYKFDD